MEGSAREEQNTALFLWGQLSSLETFSSSIFQNNGRGVGLSCDLMTELKRGRWEEGGRTGRRQGSSVSRIERRTQGEPQPRTSDREHPLCRPRERRALVSVGPPCVGPVSAGRAARRGPEEAPRPQLPAVGEAGSGAGPSHAAPGSPFPLGQGSQGPRLPPRRKTRRLAVRPPPVPSLGSLPRSAPRISGH